MVAFSRPAPPGRDAASAADAQGGVGSARLRADRRDAGEAREAPRVGARASPRAGTRPRSPPSCATPSRRSSSRSCSTRRCSASASTSSTATRCSSCRRHRRRSSPRSRGCSGSTRPSPPGPSSTRTVATRVAPSATCTPPRRRSPSARWRPATASTSPRRGPTPTRPPTCRCSPSSATRWWSTPTASWPRWPRSAAGPSSTGASRSACATGCRCRRRSRPAWVVARPCSGAAAVAGWVWWRRNGGGAPPAQTSRSFLDATKARLTKTTSSSSFFMGDHATHAIRRSAPRPQPAALSRQR